ncbi:MAG TPA: hypothetical protein VGO91_00480 [Pyrinomonadaceae bacterium]|jgi:hypothetical protein|nr:hypothetical protein [Pyrinomonadaceae bacterium]
MIDLLKERRIVSSVRRDGQWSVLTGLAALVLMAALILSVYLLVRYLFGANYLSLYLKYGYFISLAFTFVTLLLNLDQDRELISTHPFHYASACLRLMRGPLQAVGADFKRDTADHHTTHHPEIGPVDSDVWGAVSQLAQTLMHVFDLFISGFFSIVFIIVVSAWLLFVAPLQYFIFLICGAPARVIGKSMKKAHQAVHQAETNILDVPASEATLAATTAGAEETVSAWKPVRMTSALALMVLWSLSRVL